ncbi:probable protein phosphatase CG10417 isoform X1 [Anastrepha obliqua]|uniref:probable protein phosphatase CG10417 isoform X1 n=1 Tax=Anastrepha obliqua TaxID=95512 RepID=UPI00240A867E|nr:probable protein phosphatase CG10417 isoform X1 [Anastrepha obliqua]XP_054738135.1 probable protein phosphatase CG10417 isoform X1 [Anastrepha obliqua]XP_054738136.1 probable protein phosphatase CG10417 isoform X1 [Anastrepha obliqua]
MGAYLSEPKTDKVSTDESNDILTIGASSMQGWRNNQEDAHNSILNFDVNTSFFAVYDGHGGAEVATYCADKLPQFLKELSSYKDSKFEEALKEAFLGFDKTLLEPQVVEILKVLAGEKGFDGDDSDAHDDDEDFEDLAELHEESHLPLDEVLEKYKGGPSMPSLKRLKDGASGAKPQSPYLRGRRAAAVIADATNKAVLDPDSKPQGSSTSAAAAALSTATGPSSSHKVSACASGASSSKTISITPESGPSPSISGNISKMDTEEPEEDSTVSSSSSSGSKPHNNNNTTDIEISKSEDNVEKISANGPMASAATNIDVCPDSSHTKEVEQNGSVSSSEKKAIKKQNSPFADMDTTVSGSNDAARRIQNGTIGSTSSSAGNKQIAGSATITSTSKDPKKSKKTDVSGEDESTDDDADYEESAEEGEARHGWIYSSEDEEIEEAENSSAFSSDEENEEEEAEEDEESALANDQFCADMIEEPGKDSGCTAVVALLNGRDLYVANAGDSRCVVCRNGKAIDMSLDHKPEDEEESARIIKAGGRVTLDGRVNGGLNLSRAIGDHAYKMNLELSAEDQMISALPDVRKLIITPEDEFMVLACDGIWNYLSSEEVVDFIRQRLKDDSKKISQICEELFDTCLAPNTIGDGTGCDNMTAVIVRFESKILDMPTKINPDEIVLIKDIVAKTSPIDASAQQKEQQCLKRAASPTSDENSSEADNANKTKRLKTDEETSSTTNAINKVTVETSTSSNNDTAASSSTSEAAAAVASITEQKDCDSNTTASTNEEVDSDNIAESST